MRNDTLIANKHRLYSRSGVEGKIHNSVDGTMQIGGEVDIGTIYRHTLMIDPEHDKAYKCHYRGAIRWDYHGKMRYAKGDFYIFQRVSDDWQNGLYYFVFWEDGKRKRVTREMVTTLYREQFDAYDPTTWEY